MCDPRLIGREARIVRKVRGVEHRAEAAELCIVTDRHR